MLDRDSESPSEIEYGSEMTGTNKKNTFSEETKQEQEEELRIKNLKQSGTHSMEKSQSLNKTVKALLP
jgi:hypothetical protein